jgi:hypothetical protein
MTLYEFLLQLGFCQWIGVLSLAALLMCTVIACICGATDILTAPFKKAKTEKAKPEKARLRPLACPRCPGTLEVIQGVPPHDTDHLQCNQCDGTYFPEQL